MVFKREKEKVQGDVVEISWLVLWELEYLQPKILNPKKWIVIYDYTWNIAMPYGWRRRDAG